MKTRSALISAGAAIAAGFALVIMPGTASAVAEPPIVCPAEVCPTVDPVVTDPPETTAAPVTTAGPEVTTAAPVTTAGPATTEPPVTTAAPVTTAGSTSSTGVPLTSTVATTTPATSAATTLTASTVPPATTEVPDETSAVPTSPITIVDVDNSESLPVTGTSSVGLMSAGGVLLVAAGITLFVVTMYRRRQVGRHEA